MDYKEQLQDKRWKKRRIEILICAQGKCEQCGHNNLNHLQVHHKKYINGLKAWEYERKYLIVLCRECHNKTHRSDLIKKSIDGMRISKIMGKMFK